MNDMTRDEYERSDGYQKLENYFLPDIDFTEDEDTNE
jgi:hypothetical protein